jgi:Putative adhesin
MNLETYANDIAPVIPAFATPEPITVSVELPVGDVRVVASDREDATVQVRPTDQSRAADVRSAERTRIERVPGGLLVKAPGQHGLGLLGKPGSVDVTIELPAGSGLHVDSSVAAFHATGRLGQVRIKTSVGNVDLDETGRLDLSTGAGAITVARVDGDAEVSTGSGRIRLGQIDGAAVVKNSNGATRIDAIAGDLQISAGNGNLTVGRADGNVTASAAHGEIRIGQLSRGTAAIKTGFGEIELGLRAGTAAQLDLFTSFGRVRNTLNPAGTPEPADARLAVLARTSHGDITIRRA